MAFIGVDIHAMACMVSPAVNTRRPEEMKMHLSYNSMGVALSWEPTRLTHGGAFAIGLYAMDEGKRQFNPNIFLGAFGAKSGSNYLRTVWLLAWPIRRGWKRLISMHYGNA